MSQKRRPVCIFGASHGYRLPPARRGEPYKAAIANDAEFWSCNGIIWDVDVMFEIHRRAYLKAVYGAQFRTYEKELRMYATGVTQGALEMKFEGKPGPTTYHAVKHPVLVTAHAWPQLPSLVYPERLVARAVQYGAWHCGSFDYMLAYALEGGYTDIRLYNINFTRGGEPLAAGACLSYWVGVANGRGATVRLFNCDTIGKTYQLLESTRQYGLEDMVLVEGTRKRARLNWPGLA